MKEWGVEVEYLINNAGFGGAGHFQEREAAADQAMIDVNIRALMELTRLFLRDMVARGSGRVLNVASTAGLIPGGPNQAVYGATKAFIVSLTKGLWQELQGTGVTITALCPSATDTEFAEVADPEGRRRFSKTRPASKRWLRKATMP